MPRRPTGDDPEAIRKKLTELLRDFEKHLLGGDLRQKVLALIPCHRLLRDLGCSLIPKADASSARDRILTYLRKYPFTILGGEELAVVSGISEWARRVRELRVQFGWAILSGITAKQMAEEGEFPLPGVEVVKMEIDDYILIAKNEDREQHFRRRSGQRSHSRSLEGFAIS